MTTFSRVQWELVNQWMQFACLGGTEDLWDVFQAVHESYCRYFQLQWRLVQNKLCKSWIAIYTSRVSIMSSICDGLKWLVWAEGVLCCWQPIERQPRHFNKLKIPQALQSALPFASKPKLLKKRKHPLLEQKRAVVNQLNTIWNEKASYFVVWIYAVL